jgi:predicted nucleic acid-binding protein
MKTVFVDTCYWIATARPNDPWAVPAKRARDACGPVLLVTTDEVLTEFLTALSGGGPTVRRTAARMVRSILENANVKVLPQGRDSFLDGLELYEKREDKEYSLTDCVSMNAMRSLSIQEILTNDHHFQQEGLTVLMRKDDP